MRRAERAGGAAWSWPVHVPPARLAVMLALVLIADADITAACTLDGVPLYGEVQVVDSFADFDIEVVESFADLKVEPVEHFADGCGQWTFVDSFPDFTVRFVDSFPDFTVRFVEHFPGAD